MKRTLITMLNEAAERWPDHVYAFRKIDSGFAPTTFSQARTIAREFAAWLIKENFTPSDAAVIIAEGSPEWISSELGLIHAGCISVPLSIKLLQEEIPFRLDHSGAKAVITTANQLEKVLGALKKAENRNIRIIYLDDDPDHARGIAEKSGVAASRVVGYAEARAQGRAALTDPGSSIQAKLDATIAAIAEDDTVNICYTSGTTGNPKGIMLTHLNYWANCHDGVKHFEMPEGMTTLIILPVDHSFAHTVGLYVAMLIGMSIYFVDSRGGGIATLRNIPINLKEAEPKFIMTVPALSGNFMKKIIAGIEEKGGPIEKIFKAGIKAGIAWNGNGFNKPGFATRALAFFPYFLAKALIFNKVKGMIFGNRILYCVGGGALLDIKQQEFYAAFGLPIYQGYGLTEAAPVISSNSPINYKFGTSGRLMPSVECRLLKEDGSEASLGENAEIVIRGLNVMKGYYKNPDATAKALRDGWLYTGDLAHFDEDGFLVVVGREKALLIAEDGEKYSPEEIEEAVTGSTDLIDVIVAWCEQKKYVTALVTLDTAKVERLVASGRFSDASTLLEYLKNQFNAYKSDPLAKKVQGTWMPGVFQIVGEAFSDKDGTVNSTMKIVRHRIAELHSDLIEYSYTKEGSDTVNERNLATLRKLFKLP